MIGFQTRAFEGIENTPLQFVFGNRFSGSDARARVRDRILGDRCDLFGSAHVRRELRRRPRRVDTRNQITGTDHGRTRCAHHLQHTRRDAIEIRNRVACRIFHRDMLPRDQ